MTRPFVTVGGSEDGKCAKNSPGLSMWKKRYGMEFNPTMCQEVWGTTASDINIVYISHGQVLEVVTTARYLGVDISSGLSCCTQIDRTAANANRL